MDRADAERLLRRAEAAVEAVDLPLEPMELAARGPLYAHGVRDALQWMLGLPAGSPWTTDGMVLMLDRLAAAPSVVRLFLAQLRRARKDRGMTQMALAVELGAAQTSLCRWETGMRTPPVETLLQWSAVLEVEVPAAVLVALVELSPAQGGRRAECGTVSGRIAHRRRNQEPCQPCRDAWAEYMRLYRAARKTP